jgi:hypothetical protein
MQRLAQCIRTDTRQSLRYVYYAQVQFAAAFGRVKEISQGALHEISCIKYAKYIVY